MALRLAGGGDCSASAAHPLLIPQIRTQGTVDVSVGIDGMYRDPV